MSILITLFGLVFVYADGHGLREARCAFTVGARKTVFFNPDLPMDVKGTPAKLFSELTLALVAGVAMVAFGIAASVHDRDL